jgi:hypothetical protein
VGFLVTLGMILLLVVGISSLQGWHNGLLDNLDTRTTRLYVRAPRKSVASVLSKAAFFMNLPKWKDQESSNDIIDVALIEDAEGSQSWVTKKSESDAIVLSNENLRHLLIEKNTGTQNQEPFSRRGYVRSVMRKSDATNVLIVPIDQSMSGSALRALAPTAIAMTLSWNDAHGTAALFYQDVVSPLRSATLKTSDASLSIAIQNPEKAMTSTMHMLDTLSPGLSFGLRGIMDQALLENFGSGTSMDVMSVIEKEPLFFIADNHPSGNVVLFAGTQHDDGDLMQKLWNGAVSARSTALVRTIPLLRNQVRRDVVAMEPAVERRTERGFALQTLMTSGATFAFGTHDKQFVLGSAVTHIPSTIASLPTLAVMKSNSVRGTIDMGWLFAFIDRNLPFLLRDDGLRPFFGLVQTSGKVDFEVQNNDTASILHWTRRPPSVNDLVKDAQSR